MNNNESLRSIVKGWRDFIGKEWDTYPKEEKIRWINAYRKAEQDTNESIERHGSVQAWYESGEGRLLNLP